MNFVSNLLDSIPVVGHVKGVVHYAVGDSEGGNKAMYQSTRTTAVLGGGVAGCVAGPAGAAVGAMYAGLLTDAVASVAMDEPQGLVQSSRNIGQDIAAGRNPTASIASTALQLTFDGVGGIGMGGIAGAASSVSEKAATKTAESLAKKLASNVGEEVIEKSVQLTAQEMTKLTGRKVAEKVVQKAAMDSTQNVILVTAHVGLKASLTTDEELAEQERERARKTREERARQERERAEREQRARRDRERAEREERARQETERAEREERARQERERAEREQRARQETERAEREERARHEREREEREERARQERESQTSNENQQDTPSGTSSGASQPPQGDKDKDKDNSKEKIKLDYFEVFKRILASLLELIYGDEEEPFSQIFQNLSSGQIFYLNKIIRICTNEGTLYSVVKLVIQIFKRYLLVDVSFTDFISLMEYVHTCIMDELTERNTMSTGTGTARPTMIFNNDREAIIQDIQDIVNHVNFDMKLGYQFLSTKAAIILETSGDNSISPDFRDHFAAVYHYIKHRCVPGDGVLTIKEYYDWIRKLLEKVKETPEYEELKNSTGSRTCIYQIYVVIFSRRFKIVVKIEDGKLVLSSGFVVTKMNPDDKEGDVFIELTKEKKKKK